jgi:peptidoglycan/xylan/chitin deacetylase (PgdA/CDA1 family)
MVVVAASASVASLSIAVVAVIGDGGDVHRLPSVGAPHSSPKPDLAPRPPPPAPRTRRTDEPVPILMYHVVADPPAGAPFPGLYVSAASFAGQVEWLARLGFNVVTLREVRDHWALGRPLLSHPIVLTFDDGYRSQAVSAQPILSQYGWPAVIDLTVRNTTVSEGLPPERVRQLIGAGWEVAAHSLTHPDLTRLSAERLRLEAKLRSLGAVP